MSYLSAGDEAAFFTWLQGISGVVAVRGVGRELHISLKSRRLSQASLREFIALYCRFGGVLSELAQFESDANSSWFRSPAAAWYTGVFRAEPNPRSSGLVFGESLISNLGPAMEPENLAHRAPAWEVWKRNAQAAHSEKNVAELEGLLLHPYQWFRIKAAEMLAAIPSASSSALLGAALNDRCEHVAEAAADALAAIGTPEALELLRCSFVDDQIDRPNHLANAISRFGREGFDILVLCAHSASPTLRFHAARGLGSTGMPDAEAILSRLSFEDLEKTRTGATVATAAKAALKTLGRLQGHGKA